MKIRFALAAVALVAAGGLAAQALTKMTQGADEAEMMKKWMEFATPGEGHKQLADKAGKWNMKVKMIMAPGAPAEESPATSEVKWIMDGRFLEDHTQGEFQGMPFVGLGHLGYDNMKKKYVGTWMDNMGTAIMTMEGTYDAKTKTFNYTGEMPDVMAGVSKKNRTTEKIVDKDNWVMSSYATGPDGKEYLAMEITYTRAK
ncbi:MAG: DUF1579 domain-containing protein [Planctomycetes bacterium]|nr:DUF1579 domain-containing protein [Planctomycetota bacterium]